MVDLDLQKQLINVLLSRNIYFEDERNDAAMALRLFPTSESLQALIQVASNPKERRGLQNCCGESIAIIWEEKNLFDQAIYDQLQPSAKIEIDDLKLQRFKKDE